MGSSKKKKFMIQDHKLVMEEVEGGRWS